MLTAIALVVLASSSLSATASPILRVYAGTSFPWGRVAGLRRELACRAPMGKMARPRRGIGAFRHRARLREVETPLRVEPLGRSSATIAATSLLGPTPPSCRRSVAGCFPSSTLGGSNRLLPHGQPGDLGGEGVLSVDMAGPG